LDRTRLRRKEWIFLKIDFFGGWRRWNRTRLRRNHGIFLKVDVFGR